MPLDLTESSPNQSPSVSARTTNPASTESPPRLSGVLEILRVREAGQNGRLTGLPALGTTGSEAPRTSGPIPMPPLRSSSTILNGITPRTIFVPNGRRREGLRVSSQLESAFSLGQPPGLQSTSQRPRQRLQADLPSISNTNWLRRELDSDDFPSRLSMLRANALLMQDDLERVMDELALPFINSRSDSTPPRNHHRHSSMSTSPRVLESRNPSSSPNRSDESDLNDRLEDVLFFLDMQRLPSTDRDKLIHMSHFRRSLVAECSWLRPGGIFHGVQSFTGDSNVFMSNLAWQIRDAEYSASKEWKVEVVIDQVDYSDMSIAGSMTAYDMPESSDRQSVMTFWTGEVSISFNEVDVF
jgi:hypothetical protein